MANLANLPVPALIDSALHVEDDPDAYWDLISELQERGNREVFDASVELCGAEDAERREVGLDVLAQLGIRDELPFRDESIPIILGLCDEREPAEVLFSAISALGHLHDERGREAVLRFKGHPEADVRYAVACAIPSVAGDPPDKSAVDSLLELMRDDDSKTRDWATFGLGSQLEDADSERIRSALWERIDDDGGDTAGEALLGLAARGDRGIVDRLMALLAGEIVGNLEVESAWRIGDSRLLPLLLALKARHWDENDPRGQLLGQAINACQGTG